MKKQRLENDLGANVKKPLVLQRFLLLLLKLGLLRFEAGAPRAKTLQNSMFFK